MANSGLSNSGYSESSVVSMYNAYQNRVGTAKESLNNTIMNYNNAITQATLANNEKLAEIANQTLEKQAALNQQAFEYKNNVILQKEQQLEKVNEFYYQKYQDVLGQINNEIELQMRLDEIDREYEIRIAEIQRQHEEWQAEFEEQKRQREIANQQWEREFALKQSQSTSSYYGSYSNPYGNNESSNEELDSSNYGALKDAIQGYINIIENGANKAQAQQGLQATMNKVETIISAGKMSRSQANQLFNIANKYL